MQKYAINEQEFLDTVKNWIEAEGEVYVCFEYWRSGGMGGEVLTRTFEAFKKIVADFQNRKGVIKVYRHPRLLLRGIASDELLSRALELIPDGTDWFLFHTTPVDPNILVGTGDNTHQELQQTFTQFGGQEIALGLDSDCPPQERIEGQNYMLASND